MPLCFLVVSLGNRAPYSLSLHSAGHLALCAAQKVLAPSQPPFALERYGKKSCKVSAAFPYTFIQSPTMMNNCGTWLHGAFRETLQRHQLQPSELALVIVHDELESAFGGVRVRDWIVSHRGHNGVKNVKNCMGILRYPKDHWCRIAIGIDRPEERTPEVVSKYVLSNMTPRQLELIDTDVGPTIVRYLHELRAQWDDGSDGSDKAQAKP
ncbi:mitochondrial peptidyl-tRNA hydrolase [Ustulina deusta]|nr:mitochondrial peptidyl-tRNA hydrolase [Ustulina deusta]KAI3328798.1 mitochondrial peptidyl-tRNA hydrolase [Ustulina deusta]